MFLFETFPSIFKKVIVAILNKLTEVMIQVELK